LKGKIGLLTDNIKILEDLKSIDSIYTFVRYKSIDLLKKDEFSLLLIDLNMFSSIDDVQFLLLKIRKKISDLRIIIILGVDQISLIDCSWFVDDFILYPFRKNEIFLRVKLLLFENINEEELIAIGQLTINLKEYSVYNNEKKLDLTYKEFELLRLFGDNRGVVFTRKELLNKIWGVEYIGGTRTVDVHIRRLRRKLGDDFSTIIQTVRNVGYLCS
jgi:DNA-binding response OmpR family regulator